MSSPISSALAKLDGSLQTVQGLVDSLRAGLEVNDSELSYGLADARQNAVVVRDLIRAERSDATWEDRGTLEYLIHELEVAAHQQRNEQRRLKLLELGDEFEAGAVRHRSESRTAALNKLRQEAIQELRAAAAIPEQALELPGPEAGQWLHWACNLQEEKDADALTSLRTDFPALDHFAGEMEESYWIAGERIRRIPVAPATPSRPAANLRRAPEPPAYSPAPPSSSDHGRTSQNSAARPETAPGGNYATAVARAYERPAASTPVSGEARRSEVPLPQRGGLALVADPADLQTETETKTCDRCGASYSAEESHACPAADPVRRAPVSAAPTVVPRPAYPAVDKSRNGGNGASSQKEAPVNTSAATAPPAANPAERPASQPTAKPSDKKAKSRKQRRAEAAAATATATATVVPAAKPVAVPEAPRQKPPEEKVTPRAVEEKEAWTQKWQDLRENGGEALGDGKWRTYLFAPEALVAIAVLLLVVFGSIWMLRRKPASSAPAVAVQNTAPSSGTTAPTTTAPSPVQQAAAETTQAPNGTKPSDNAKPQDQSTAAKANNDSAQTKDATPPPAQVLNIPVEAPKGTASAKKEEPSGDVAPPSLPGAMTSNMGPLVKDISANVPKLAGQKLRISSGVAQGQLVRQVNPQYPMQARQERVQGTVVLQAVIGKDGSVEKLSVVSGPSQLTKAAMDAVKQWRYRPFALNGEPVEADTQINVNFKLGE